MTEFTTFDYPGLVKFWAMGDSTESAAELLTELESRLKTDDWSERAYAAIQELFRKLDGMELTEAQETRYVELLNKF